MMWGVMALCIFTVAIALILTYLSLQYVNGEPASATADSILLIDLTDSLSQRP